MAAFPCFALVLRCFVLLLLCSTLLSAVSGQNTSYVESLLLIVAEQYGDNVFAAPPAFQELLFNASAAIFYTPTNNLPAGSTLGGTSGDLSLVTLNSSYASSTAALCIDGSAYAYYLRRSSSQPTKWVVFLQGGGQCVDPTSCSLRLNTPYGSSTGFLPFYTDSTNVLSTDPSQNPQFYDWNLVYMPYCSADSWGGTRTVASPDSWGFIFAGWNITHAVIADLTLTQGMSAATDVVLSGVSAGGIGTFLHVDNFAAAVPNAVVAGYPQAGFFTVGQTYPEWLLAGANPLSTTPRPYYDTNSFAIVLPVTLAAQQLTAPTACLDYFYSLGQPTNISQCALMPFLYRFIRSPLFILENRFDTYQIFLFNVVPELPEVVVGEYVFYFGVQMVQTIVGDVLAKEALGALDGFFIPSCLQHDTYPEPAPSYDGNIDGIQAATVFQGWYDALTAGALTTTSVQDFRFYDTANYLPLARCSITDDFSTPTAVSGDPQLVGLQGQSFQVHGIDGAVYNLISTPSLQLNARFGFLPFSASRRCPVMPSTGAAAKSCWSHPGSYLTELGLALLPSNTRVRVVAGDADTGFAAVEGGDDGAVQRLSSHELRLQGAGWTVEVENIDGFLNLRQVEVTGGLSAAAGQRSHGLLGSTWRRVRGSGRVKEIEGDVDDYAITDGDLFGSQFLYNRFAA